MKKSLLAISGALLAVTTTFATFGVNTAFADGHGEQQDGWSMNFNMQGNNSFGNGDMSVSSNTSGTSNLQGLPTLPPFVTGKGHSDGDNESGEHDGHNKKKQSEKDKSKDSNETKAKGVLNFKVNTSTHGAAVAQLHAALATFHQDILKAQAAHRSLEQAARDFITAMQDAVAAGDTSAIQQGSTGAQQIISTLQQALAAQKEANAQSQTSTTAANKGDLSAAINAIQTAEAREVSKTNAMNQAATALEALAAQLEKTVASYTPSSSTPTNNTTTNTTVTNNNVVTINNTVG